MTEVMYVQEEREQKIAAIKQAIEVYIHGNPEIPAFRFFLPIDQDRDEIKQAAAQVSRMAGKPIDLIYPVTPEEMKMSTTETTSSPPATKTRNEVLQEIRTRFGTDQAHTNWLIDGLLAAWDARDRFISIFGADVAQSYLQAGFEPVEEGQCDDDNE